ncbi:MAG: sulfatase-like hydrolase/transferase [Verrucomicrobiota bacterium]|nr:sulfatase-like hydrolase/transferase [Verrucomicrobiota bacterium]
MRRIFLCAAAILILAGLASRAADQPNVLFLFTDDQRPDTIAALGNPALKTPNLDRIASSGFVFNNAYCMGSMVGAVCNPSRHMLLSGRSLFRYDPKRKEGTFADVMNQAGYVTWHIGKRGNTAQEYHKAFQHSAYLQDNQERTSGHHGRAAANAAIEFLNTGWDKSQPLFMYIAFEGPHDPRVAAREWMELYQREKIPLPENYLPLHPINNGDLFVRDEALAPWPRTPEVVRQHLHDYYACISSIDHHIGRILKALEEQKQLEKTILVFSSDHGLAIGSHGLFGKQNLYEDGMGVPFIFAGPGIPKGRTEAFAYLYDIFPTVAALAGAKAPGDLDGKDLGPVIRGETAAVRDTVFLAYKEVQRAVRRGDWKLIRYPKVDYTQLFNLKEDPHEVRNLAGDPAHAEKVRELLALLAQEQKRFGDQAPLTVENPEPAAVDEAFFKSKAPAQTGAKKRKE